MIYRIAVIPYTLHFRQPAGTSRGVYRTRKVWYVRVAHPDEPERAGYGECAPLPALSCDDTPGYETVLRRCCGQLAETGRLDAEGLRSYPSVLFGFESALRHFHRGRLSLWDTSFSRGEAGIPINGLIWMGRYEEMLARIEEKIEAGFRCIKLKIGAIGFDDELELLRRIRSRFSAADIELRVDANGAFTPAEAPAKLERLARFDLHSVEQPIRAGQWEEMARLAASSPVPVALDEELIGVNDPAGKRRLLEAIRPQYIVLKPSLHGGMAGSAEWIAAAGKVRAGWWITSALESNIGLNAIAQWCATFHNPLPQGLGTGLLFTDNIPSPLRIRGEKLWFDPAGETGAAECAEIFSRR